MVITGLFAVPALLSLIWGSKLLIARMRGSDETVNKHGKQGMSITFHVVIEQDEAGWLVVECPALPGCVSQGKTEQEALDNIKEAIPAWLEVEDEKAITEVRNRGIEGKEYELAV